MSRTAAIAIAVGVAHAPGCLDYHPEVGPPVRERCLDEDSDPGAGVSFATDIVAGIFRNPSVACADCHTASGPTPIGLEVGGLDLASYASLREGGAVAGERIVVPGSPCSSVLVQKVSAGPPFGSRMPQDGPPFLSDRELRRLQDWIFEGALDN